MPSQVVHQWQEKDAAMPCNAEAAAEMGLDASATHKVEALVDTPKGRYLVFVIDGKPRVLSSEMWKPAPVSKKPIPWRTYRISRDRAHQQIGLFEPWSGDPVPYIKPNP